MGQPDTGKMGTVITLRATEGDVLRLQALTAIHRTSTSEVIRTMIRREADAQIGKGRMSG